LLAEFPGSAAEIVGRSIRRVREMAAGHRQLVVRRAIVGQIAEVFAIPPTVKSIIVATLILGPGKQPGQPKPRERRRDRVLPNCFKHIEPYSSYRIAPVI